MSARAALLACAVGMAALWAQPAAAMQQAPKVAAPATAAQRPAAQPAGNADAMADAAFKAWDTDRNGALSPAEFRVVMAALTRRAEARTALALRLREQFDKVDANGNGGIEAAEYGNLLLVRAAGKSAPALAAFDRNHDQRLDFAEYVALVERLSPTQRAPGKAP